MRNFLFAFAIVRICIFFPPHQVAGRIFPDQGLNLCPLHWEHGVLAKDLLEDFTGSPGKSLTMTANHLWMYCVENMVHVTILKVWVSRCFLSRWLTSRNHLWSLFNTSLMAVLASQSNEHWVHPLRERRGTEGDDGYGALPTSQPKWKKLSKSPTLGLLTKQVTLGEHLSISRCLFGLCGTARVGKGENQMMRERS